MTLFEYLKNYNGEELTVFDNDYDIEVYFYKNDDPVDSWDNSMMQLSELLTVSSYNENGVTVNLSELIENRLSDVSDLFIDPDINAIMDDIESILAGNVSEKWLEKFVKGLKGV